MASTASRKRVLLLGLDRDLGVVVAALASRRGEAGYGNVPQRGHGDAGSGGRKRVVSTAGASPGVGLSFSWGRPSVELRARRFVAGSESSPASYPRKRGLSNSGEHADDRFVTEAFASAASSPSAEGARPCAIWGRFPAALAAERRLATPLQQVARLDSRLHGGIRRLSRGAPRRWLAAAREDQNGTSPLGFADGRRRIERSPWPHGVEYRPGRRRRRRCPFASVGVEPRSASSAPMPRSRFLQLRLLAFLRSRSLAAGGTRSAARKFRRAAVLSWSAESSAQGAALFVGHRQRAAAR